MIAMDGILIALDSRRIPAASQKRGEIGIASGESKECEWFKTKVQVVQVHGEKVAMGRLR
jgi:hypothetical protein